MKLHFWAHGSVPAYETAAALAAVRKAQWDGPGDVLVVLPGSGRELLVFELSEQDSAALVESVSDAERGRLVYRIAGRALLHGMDCDDGGCHVH